MTRELLCTCGASSATHVDVGAGRFGIYGPCAATGCAGFTAACVACERPARAGDADQRLQLMARSIADQKAMPAAARRLTG